MSANELIKRSVIIGCTITIVVAVVFSVWFASMASTALLLTPILFTVASVLTIKILTTPSVEALLKFNGAFMLTNGAKLLIFLVYFVVAYLSMKGEPRIPFVVVFLLLYLFFTVMDTITLLQFYKDKENS
jgi:F0F1-type ATP synthase assembly protein I